MAASLLTPAFTLAATDGAKSDDKLWTFHSEVPAPAKSDVKEWIRPDIASIFTLDADELHKLLADAPREGTPKALNPVIISLPTPAGDFMRFEAIESPIWEPGFELRMPGTMTYYGQCIDEPAAHVRFDWTPAGFHASVRGSADGNWYVDPYWQGETTTYSSYYTRDNSRTSSNPDFHCQVEELDVPTFDASLSEKVLNGTVLKTYRLAVAATVEYVAFHGGTQVLGQAAIVTAMNRVNQVYEDEVALRMLLVANNIDVVYTTAPDPYSNGNGSTMLGQNQTNLDAVIGDANYDIGHVFSTGGGGVASLRSPCTGSKARGVTGQDFPTGDNFWIDFVAHEMGHQWGGNHSFNGVSGSCSGGNRNGSTAYEIGSGTTIQAYAGICDGDDVKSHSDAYFHSVSLDEIVAFINSGNGNNCDVEIPTGNTPPSVDAGPSFSVPISTPFTVTAAGSDADGDTVTYCWEQRDLGVARALSAADNGTSPINRSYSPTLSPSRTFPTLINVIFNINLPADKFPTVARTMDLRVVARDNRAGGGGIHSDDTVINVVSTAGPFRVTSPNTATTWTFQTQTVTWDVANTTAAPLNTSLVDILLSTDGGNTFPITLLEDTPNDGSQVVTIPPMSSSQCRIKVQAANSVYWDMSNANFTINITAGVAGWAQY